MVDSDPLYRTLQDIHIFICYTSVRNSPGKVTCPGGKQFEKVACPP